MDFPGPWAARRSIVRRTLRVTRLSTADLPVQGPFRRAHNSETAEARDGKVLCCAHFRAIEPRPLAPLPCRGACCTHMRSGATPPRASARETRSEPLEDGGLPGRVESAATVRWRIVGQHGSRRRALQGLGRETQQRGAEERADRLADQARNQEPPDPRRVGEEKPRCCGRAGRADAAAADDPGQERYGQGASTCRCAERTPIRARPARPRAGSASRARPRRGTRAPPSPWRAAPGPGRLQGRAPVARGGRSP